MSNTEGDFALFATRVFEQRRAAGAGQLATALEESVRGVVREELAEFRQSFGDVAPPATMTVEKAAAHLGLGETTLRAILAAHPDLRITFGTRHLVKVRLLSAWLETQTTIPPATRVRPAVRRRTA